MTRPDETAPTALPCPFCARLQAGDAIVASSADAFALRDGYPVSPGHTLVLPRRHVPTWFDAAPHEQLAILDLVAQVRRDLLRSAAPPDGFNLGINVGAAAGQTVMHLHVHVIPRYEGDVDDPRGGVRFVIPELGNYLEPGVLPRVRAREPLHTGTHRDPFIDRLRRGFRRATEVDIVAAFVMDSGLRILEPELAAAVQRGARVRLIAGDYLHITQADALRRLLEWPDILTGRDDDASAPGSVETRVIHVADLTAPTFHPKSWRIETPDAGVAWVGSSNISSPALRSGVEWNLAADRALEPQAYAEVRAAFDALWSRAAPLTREWVAAYRERARQQGDAPWSPPGEVDALPTAPPEPRPIQQEALAALARSRQEGRRRGVVVLATGLGKTYLAAFDIARFAELRRPHPTRVLFLAHRVEILRQASRTLAHVLPDAEHSWFIGPRADLDGDLVFASVAKLGRPEHLARLAPDAFDYVVIDEAHHTTAPTYRRILAHLAPSFALGLTATPDRADEADVRGLFDDHVVFRLDLGEGIHRGELVPFRYAGVKDTIDYQPIPWRNRRFDPAALADAAQTTARMETLQRAWTAYPGTRSLVFCCSIDHADFVRRWLDDHDVRAVACHSGDTSAPRERSLRALEAGELDAVCAVDLFNEGVDVPNVDRVVMLRPTESPIVFLQQLGRGLRKAPAKPALRVIDFVGNHRVFLDRIRTLIDLAPTRSALRAFLESEAAPDLPPGCAIELELEAKELLRQLLPSPGTNELISAYRELRASREERPTAGELYRMNYNPQSLRAYPSWLHFIHDESDLTPPELEAFQLGADWFAHLQRTSMTKSFKMVTLEVLLEQDALLSGLPVDALSAHAHRILTASPELFAEIASVTELGDPRSPTPTRWAAYWRKNPLHFWSKGPWFALDDRFRFTLPALEAAAPATRDAFATLTFELADYRLARHRRARLTSPDTATSFRARLFSNQRHPILKLPNRKSHPGLPSGPTDVRLPDGALWRFHFAKIACNKATPAGKQDNRLPDLLRRWFGPSAGRPGTTQEVQFHRAPEGLWIEPLNAQPEQAATVLPFPRRPIRSFPTLRAAAGWQESAQDTTIPSETVALPLPDLDEHHFALRASGTSMAGFREPPIQDGDWLVLRWSRGDRLGAIEGRVSLIARGEPGEDPTHHLKRIIRDGDSYLLTSDNPDVPPMPARPTDQPLAHVVEVVKPADLAPDRGATLDEEGVVQAWGLSEPPAGPWSRVDGHLFLLLEEPGALATPQTVAPVPGLAPRPGETAFVLARTTASVDRWRYLGVARPAANRGWTLDGEVDFDTWRSCGQGRSASRPVPEWAQAAAIELAETLTAGDLPREVEARGKTFRILGKSKKGGLRIDGGAEGFAARTVSILDLAWALAAERDVSEHEGPLDEARVNRLRYLEGTPKGSTRWIDTGWAIGLLLLARAMPGSA